MSRSSTRCGCDCWFWSFLFCARLRKRKRDGRENPTSRRRKKLFHLRHTLAVFRVIPSFQPTHNFNNSFSLALIWKIFSFLLAPLSFFCVCAIFRHQLFFYFIVFLVAFLCVLFLDFFFFFFSVSFACVCVFIVLFRQERNFIFFFLGIFILCEQERWLKMHIEVSGNLWTCLLTWLAYTKICKVNICLGSFFIEAIFKGI